LVVTPQPNNSWLIEIKLKDLRSAKAIEAYQKILDITYTVDPNLGSGTYDLQVQNLDFELNDGTRIIEESRNVEIQVLRNGTGINKLENSKISGYYSGQSLIVNSPFTESITIYSAKGTLLYTGLKSVGVIEIPVSSLRGSVYIIKGSVSGTIKVR
jgi:hypothetical protein